MSHLLVTLVNRIALAAEPAAPVQRTLARAAEQASAWWVVALYLIGAMIAIVALVALSALYLIYFERKAAGHFQNRVGPNRVGPLGLFQTVADALKLLLKEDIVPGSSDKFLHTLAPIFTFGAPMVILILIPFSATLQIVDINIGVLFFTAVSSFGVFGLLMAGWSSNNKWSLLGAIRAGAQLISYELSAALAILVIVMWSGSLQFGHIVESQADGWWLFKGHVSVWLAFIIYLVAGTAELNRVPFDIPEGESELTAGFHTEYSGIRWAMFFLAEFINMLIITSVATTLFLGGWQPPHPMLAFIPGVVWYLLKVAFLIFLMMWFRWTFPRLRVDQLMRLEWKILLPIGLANLMFTALLLLFPTQLPGWIAQWLQFGLVGLLGLYFLWSLLPHSWRGKSAEGLRPF